MKQKSHSGLKKRIKVKKSKTIMVQKSCKNHLLINKSKKMKRSHLGGMHVDKTKMKVLRKLLAGKVVLKNKAKKIRKSK